MVSRPQAYFGLAVLFVINAINFADRLSITTVLDDIKKYYTDVSDTKASALAPAFLVGYMFTAPLFGHLGDTYSRKWIVIGGITFWCLACASGLLFGPDHFYLFLLSRCFVGVGEASYSTIAPTLIGDLFPPEMRKLALSLFYFAIPIGTGLGFVMGKIALDTFHDWRLIFKITPTIGALALSLLVFFKEPKRGEMDGGSSEVDQKDTSPLKERIKYLWDIKSYVWGTIGFTCCIFTMGALSWHAIDFMSIAKGNEYRGDASMIFGGVVCIGGLGGVIIGSGIAQYLRKFDARADPLVCAFGVLIAIPMAFFGLVLARSYTTFSWIFLFLAVTALSTNWAVISDMVLSVTAPNKRAFATACQILISHMFGDALSPFLVGAMKDSLSESMDDKFLAFLYSLIPSLVVLGLGVPAFLYSAKFYPGDENECKHRAEAVRSDDAHLTDFANQ